MQKTLKVGLLVDSDHIPYWASKIVSTLNKSDYAEITLVVANTCPGGPNEPRDPHNALDALGQLLRRLYENANKLVYLGFVAFDKFAKRSRPNFDQPVPLDTLLADTQIMKVLPEKTQQTDSFCSADVETIRAQGLDVLFSLGFRRLSGGILTAAKHGIWGYHFGDSGKMRGQPAGFWELTSSEPLVGAVLQILKENPDRNTVLYRSWSRKDILLLHRQRHNVYMQAVSYLPRMLECLHIHGEERFYDVIFKKNAHPEFYSQRYFKTPGNLQVLFGVGKHYLFYFLQKLFFLVFIRQWILIHHFDKSGKPSLAFWRFKKIIPPRDRLWADPFIVYRDGKHHVFIEELEYRNGKGYISTLTIDEAGQHTQPVPIIEKDYHLSYPFIFEYEGELYMLPETADNRTVELYRCVDFPRQWEFDRHLMQDTFAVDTTLHEKDGIWWMFVTIREQQDTDFLDELFLFYADSPLSIDWTPHPMSPIKSDVRSARPAGRIFEHNGNLYRPSQNGTQRYGYGIKIQLIETLNKEDYSERCVSDIKPEWDKSINAIHTYNHEHGLTVSDASKLRFRYFVRRHKRDHRI